MKEVRKKLSGNTPWLKHNASKLSHIIFFREILRALFTNFLTPVLAREFCNPLDYWLESTSPTNHPLNCIIQGLTWELKIWWIRTIMCLTHILIFLYFLIFFKWVKVVAKFVFFFFCSHSRWSNNGTKCSLFLLELS